MKINEKQINHLCYGCLTLLDWIISYYIKRGNVKSNQLYTFNNKLSLFIVRYTYVSKKKNIYLWGMGLSDQFKIRFINYCLAYLGHLYKFYFCLCNNVIKSNFFLSPTNVRFYNQNQKNPTWTPSFNGYGSI